MSARPATPPVPHLTTALSGPLNIVENLLLERETAIEEWFRRQWRQYRAPLYASVDIRNAGFKIAPVDANLFPAGLQQPQPGLQPAVHPGPAASRRRARLPL